MATHASIDCVCFFCNFQYPENFKDQFSEIFSIIFLITIITNKDTICIVIFQLKNIIETFSVFIGKK